MEHINYIRYAAQAARDGVVVKLPTRAPTHRPLVCDPHLLASAPPLSCIDSGYVPLYPSLKPVSLRSKMIHDPQFKRYNKFE